MTDFAINRACAACGGSYAEELRRLRSNLYSICPGCGFAHAISEDEAIHAHRLLERLESGERISNAA